MTFQADLAQSRARWAFGSALATAGRKVNAMWRGRPTRFETADHRPHPGALDIPATIHDLIRRRDLDALQALLADWAPDWTEAERQACLGRAVREATRLGNADALIFLLPWCRPLAGEDGFTPLMIAARAGHQACLDVLTPCSDVAARDHRGRTALDWAAAPRATA